MNRFKQHPLNRSIIDKFYRFANPDMSDSQYTYATAVTRLMMTTFAFTMDAFTEKDAFANAALGYAMHAARRVLTASKSNDTERRNGASDIAAITMTMLAMAYERTDKIGSAVEKLLETIIEEEDGNGLPS